MMGQQAGLQERLFYEFRLDDWVPADPLLRKIDGVLDLSGLRHQLGPFYGHTGRPSIAQLPAAAGMTMRAENTPNRVRTTGFSA